MQPEVIANRYRVMRAVGRGGMGTVWLCTDEVLHRQVAVKQIGTLPGESPDDTARAMREARLAAALNHKNAVSIYDVVEHDGSTWLVMEYVPSRTLSQLLAVEGQLPPERVAHIGAQVAAALSSAHSQRIVHRDIKPGNILVGDDDSAKISDFGIARGHQDTSLTQTGLVTGTPAFFSPELARGEEPTFASDVWALGITLYTALEGAPPYEPQSNPLAMLTAITQEPLPAPAHAGPLAPLLARMLEPDASRRATMEEALAALREAEQQDGPTRTLRPLPGVAAAASSPPASPELPGQQIPLEAPVEPVYERPVTVPAVSSGWSGQPGVEGSQAVAPPREGIPFGRLAMAVLALLVLAGAGALLWNTLDLGSANQANPTSSNFTNGSGSDNGGSAGNASRTPNTNEPDNTKDNPGNSKGPTDSAPTTTADPTTDPPDDDPTTDPPDDDPTTDPPDDDPTTDPPDDDPPDEGNPSDLEGFTRSYFAIVPGDLDTGWSLIAPSMQQALGRDTYYGFWEDFESVDVSDIDVVDDTTVRYRIVYNYLNGGSSAPENKQLTLQPNGDSYLITSDTFQ